MPLIITFVLMLLRGKLCIVSNNHIALVLSSYQGSSTNVAGMLKTGFHLNVSNFIFAIFVTLVTVTIPVIDIVIVLMKLFMSVHSKLNSCAFLLFLQDNRSILSCKYSSLKTWTPREPNTQQFSHEIVTVAWHKFKFLDYHMYLLL